MIADRAVLVLGMLSNEKQVLMDVQFKTIFRAYLCLLKLEEATSKDLQKAMGFATPSQAKYHLRKLLEIGLVKQAVGRDSYEVIDRRFGVLRFFLKIGTRLFPTSLFYAIFFLALTILLYVRAPYLELAYLGSLIVVKEVVEGYLQYRILA